MTVLAWITVAVILFIALPIGVGKFLAWQDRKRVASAKDWEAYVNRWSEN